MGVAAARADGGVDTRTLESTVTLPPISVVFHSPLRGLWYAALSLPLIALAFARPPACRRRSRVPSLYT